jgi:ABC-type transporter MlaC component
VPIITLPVKSFPNSVEGSQAFVKNMLDLVYLELPKRNGNQEVFNYLSVVTTEYFAFTYMSKWTIGRDVIKDLPSDLQEKYLASSKEFMILLYGEIFNTYYKQYNYSLGESVRRTDTEYSIKMKVESKVQDARNQDAILNVIWKVKYSEKEKKFFVTDVDVNGIVFLTTQKKQFGDMLNSTNNDFAKFLELLDAKNTESKKRLGISM